jgi:peptide/nickel transport system ATP-binding protein
MKARYGVTLVFISHDLSVVKNISDRVAVMYLGKLCELASADDLYRSPMHPYTRALIGAIPSVDAAHARAAPLRGELPSPISPPSGCRFRTRCPKAQARCAVEEPVMTELRPGHYVACHYPDEPATDGQAD